MLETVLRTPDERFVNLRAFFAPLTQLLNPTIRRIAGRSGVPLVGLVSHRGRCSGRTYATLMGPRPGRLRYLVDKSAMARMRHVTVAGRIEPSSERVWSLE